MTSIYLEYGVLFAQVTSLPGLWSPLCSVVTIPVDAESSVLLLTIIYLCYGVLCTQVTSPILYIGPLSTQCTVVTYPLYWGTKFFVP